MSCKDGAINSYGQGPMAKKKFSPNKFFFLGNWEGGPWPLPAPLPPSLISWHANLLHFIIITCMYSKIKLFFHYIWFAIEECLRYYIRMIKIVLKPCETLKIVINISISYASKFYKDIFF